MPQLPALLERDRGRQPRLRRPACRREPDHERCLVLAGLDADLRRARRHAALGRRAAAGDAGAGAGPGARGCCCSTSPPRRSTRPPATRSSRRSAALRRELEISIVLVSHDPEQARRLGGVGGAARCRDGSASAGRSRRCSPLTPRSTSASAEVARDRSRWSRWPPRSPSGATPTSSATSASPLVRSFLQLTAIGYVIQAIFDADTLAAGSRAADR